MRRVERFLPAKPVVLALIISASACAGARAATPVFTPAATVGPSGTQAESFFGFPSTGAILGADGSATIAWPAPDHGVEVAERLPGGGPFSAPRTISDDATGSVALAADDGGARAAAWSTTVAPNMTRLEIAVAAPAAGFAAQEEVPLPPRGPAASPDRTDERYIGGADLAVAPDGAVLVSYTDSDSRSDDVRAVTALRRPDGTWTEPQVLDSGVYGDPTVAADVTGLHVLWAVPPHGGSNNRIRVLYTADASSDGHFGEPQMVSEPDRDAVNGGRGPQFVANRRGDLLVAWGAEWFSSQVEAAFRPAGGAWQQPRVLSDGVPNSQRPTAALDDRGDALVAWTDGTYAWARFRPAGGAWKPASSSFARQGTIDIMPAALDPDGNGLMVSAVARSVGTVDTIAGFELPRDGKLAPATTIDTGTDPVSLPQVATDPFGNGLVVWLTGRDNEPSQLRTASYSGRPPAITVFRARRAAFVVRASEPSRVTVTVRGRHHSVSERARIRRGATTLPFGRTVRALVRHHGRYRATIRARDPGPRASRPRTITFSR